MRKSVLCLIFVAGCMVGPNYRAPENDVCDGWSAPNDASEQEPVCDWWKVFNDPLLTKYIETATESNKDVLIAEANILAARGSRMVTASALFPHIGADFNATRLKFSKDGIIFGPFAATGKNPKPENLFSSFLDATWELDLFGKTRRAVEAATATIESDIEQRNNILISVWAEVALNYMEVRSSQQQIDLTENNIRLLELQAEIVQKQFQYGYVSLVTYETVLANLAAAKASLPDLWTNLYRGIYAISVLTGSIPETLVDELLVVQPLPVPPETVAVGLRSDLLRRRPDVRVAERQLAAATANIGVSVAAFFPSISIGALEGYSAMHIRELFKSSSNAWLTGGNASVPLFEGGKNVGNLRLSQAEERAAYETYQQTVLQALEETEGALVAFSQEKKTARDLKESADHYRKIVGLAREQFAKGLINRVSFLQSEQLLISSELNLLESNTQVLLDLIFLYKALGGIIDHQA
jgi:multidrug efflux system outer membrane protein